MDYTALKDYIFSHADQIIEDTLYLVHHQSPSANKEYANRCALFFDGEIVSCAPPKPFFAGNSFYTTSANRICSQWMPEAITWEEVAERCAEVTTKPR